MPTPRLLKKNPLTFTRITTNTGYFDNSGNWVEGTLESPIQATGSLQPYKMGKERIDLPEGVKAIHSKIYYTITKLQTADDIANQEPDKTTIDGVSFVVYDQEDWYSPAYNSAHYKTYLVREDKL